MVLVSNGKEYNNFSTQYFFDNETGRFTNGQLVFNDLMADDLGADAHFVVSSVYVLPRRVCFVPVVHVFVYSNRKNLGQIVGCIYCTLQFGSVMNVINRQTTFP